MRHLSKLYKDAFGDPATFDIVLKAWAEGRSAHRKNDSTDGKSVFYHNNEIVRGTPQSFEITFAGWQTPTTKARLNMVLGKFAKDYDLNFAQNRIMLRNSTWSEGQEKWENHGRWIIDKDAYIKFDGGKLATEIESFDEESHNKQYRQHTKAVNELTNLVYEIIVLKESRTDEPTDEDLTQIQGKLSQVKELSANLGREISYGEIEDKLRVMRPIYGMGKLTEAFSDDSNILKHDIKYIIKKFIFTKEENKKTADDTGAVIGIYSEFSNYYWEQDGNFYVDWYGKTLEAKSLDELWQKYQLAYKEENPEYIIQSSGEPEVKKSLGKITDEPNIIDDDDEHPYRQWAICLECGEKFIEDRDIQLCDKCVDKFDLDLLWAKHDEGELDVLDFNESEKMREQFRKTTMQSSKKIAQDEEEPTVEEEAPTDEEKPQPDAGQPDMGGGDMGGDEEELDPNQPAEGQTEKPEVTPELMKKLTPMDSNLLAKLEHGYLKALTKGDVITMDNINLHIKDILTKYLSPSPVNEMSPESFVARKMQTHTGIRRDYFPLMAKASQTLKELQHMFHMSIGSVGIVKVSTDDWSPEPKSGWVEWVVTLRRLGSNYPGRRAIIRINVVNDKAEFIPIIWDMMGNQYNLDTDGVEAFLGTKYDKSIIDLEKSYMKEEADVRKALDKKKLDTGVYGLGTQPITPSDKGVSAPKTNVGSKKTADKVKCPNCGIPTIEDKKEGLTEEEMLCEKCYKEKYGSKKVARDKKGLITYWDVSEMSEALINDMMKEPDNDDWIMEMEVDFKIPISGEEVRMDLTTIEEQYGHEAMLKALNEDANARDEISTLVYNDSDYFEMTFEDEMNYLTEVLNKKNPDNLPWDVRVENFGWRNLSGSTIVNTNDGREFLQKVLPKTDCSFYIYENGKDGIKIQNYHHDSPMGNEWYYAKPTKENIEEYASKKVAYECQRTQEKLKAKTPFEKEASQKKATKYCQRCGNPVQPETDPELKKEYPYYCPECDENMYGMEVTDKPDTKASKTALRDRPDPKQKPDFDSNHDLDFYFGDNDDYHVVANVDVTWTHDPYHNVWSPQDINVQSYEVNDVQYGGNKGKPLNELPVGVDEAIEEQVNNIEDVESYNEPDYDAMRESREENRREREGTKNAMSENNPSFLEKFFKNFLKQMGNDTQRAFQKVLRMYNPSPESKQELVDRLKAEGYQVDVTKASKKYLSNWKKKAENKSYTYNDDTHFEIMIEYHGDDEAELPFHPGELYDVDEDEVYGGAVGWELADVLKAFEDNDFVGDRIIVKNTDSGEIYEGWGEVRKLKKIEGKS